jgi:hypothetical protein
MPGDVDGAESAEQFERLAVEGLQARMLHLPLSGQTADNELAIAAYRNSERLRLSARTPQKFLQRGDQGVEFRLIVGHTLAELDPLRG